MFYKIIKLTSALLFCFYVNLLYANNISIMVVNKFAEEKEIMVSASFYKTLGPLTGMYCLNTETFTKMIKPNQTVEFIFPADIIYKWFEFAQPNQISIRPDHPDFSKTKELPKGQRLYNSTYTVFRDQDFPDLELTSMCVSLGPYTDNSNQAYYANIVELK